MTRNAPYAPLFSPDHVTSGPNALDAFEIPSIRLTRDAKNEDTRVQTYCRRKAMYDAAMVKGGPPYSHQLYLLTEADSE
jgi:hypothetical protein